MWVNAAADTPQPIRRCWPRRADELGRVLDRLFNSAHAGHSPSP